MKKVIPIVLTAFLAACGGDNNDDATVANAQTNTPTAGATPADPSTTTGSTPATIGATPAPSAAPTTPTATPPAATTDTNANANPSNTFLSEVYQSGVGELQLAQLALQRATNPDVRRFAQTLIDHHTQMNATLSQLAQANAITLPTAASAEDATLLTSLTSAQAADFDRLYMQHNLAAHREDLALFSQQANMNSNLAVSGTGATGTTGATPAGAGTTGATGTTTGSGGTGTTSTVNSPGAGTGAAGTTTDPTSATGTTGTGTTTGAATGAGTATPSGLTATPAAGAGTATGNTTGAATGAGTATATPSIAAQTQTFAMNALPALNTHLLLAKEISGSIDPAAYILAAYEDGLAEIALGQLAAQKATNAEVKAFATMMVNEHTALNNTIKTLATAKGITLPADSAAAALPVEHRIVQNSLSQLSGNDFDKAYMSHNVIVHLADVNATTVQSQSGTDAEVRALATESLPRLTMHFDNAKQLYQTLSASFLVSAYQSNITEILLAKLATSSQPPAQSGTSATAATGTGTTATGPGTTTGTGTTTGATTGTPQGQAQGPATTPRATNAAVLSFAQQMIADHTNANAQVATLAAQENVRLPEVLPAEAVLAFRTLWPLSGEEFDRAYMTTNVDAHTATVNLFTDRAQNETDPEQKQFAQATLPILQGHLTESQTISTSVGGGTTSPNSTDTTGATDTTGTGTGTATGPDTGTTTGTDTGTTTGTDTGTTTGTDTDATGTTDTDATTSGTGTGAAADPTATDGAATDTSATGT
jgi:predicted outer membrane protein